MADFLKDEGSFIPSESNTIIPDSHIYMLEWIHQNWTHVVTEEADVEEESDDEEVSFTLITVTICISYYMSNVILASFFYRSPFPVMSLWS